MANARAVLALRAEEGGLDRLLWSFVGDPKAMSKDLKRRGFAFVGPTVCYAFMQAVGMVNDHAADCFRYRELLPAC
ncbi:MAG: DNA-3-methyladenine glycosylase [Acidobacteriota bacterium]|nr:DNA-3-methyladenine glycosylase [Acidobacteriota bacterium]